MLINQIHTVIWQVPVKIIVVYMLDMVVWIVKLHDCDERICFPYKCLPWKQEKYVSSVIENMNLIGTY